MLIDLIPEDACQEAVDWILGLPAGTSPEEAWRLCQRPDWMFWLLGRAAEPNKPGIVAAACEIARTVLHLAPAGEDRPRLAIEAAEAWAKDQTEENRQAADAAAWAADAAARAAAAAAADAAAWAADAAARAAWAAADAAWAAAAAWDAAAAAAAAAAARAAAAAWAAQADIIRKHFPTPPACL